jgi:surface antigen
MKFKVFAQALTLCVIVPPPVYAFNYRFLSDTVLSQLTPEDVKIGTAATLRALDAGTDSDWSNPKTGASGKIHVIKTLDVEGHQGCRLTRLDVTAGGETGHGTYTLCRRPSGQWAFYTVNK